MREVRWERMFPDQLEAAFDACPVAWFSYGLCEPHGPHNALGLDTLKAHALCRAAALAHGGIVAPPDYWHVHEVGPYASWGAAQIGEARPWLTAVPPHVHFKNLCYHVRAADALGFHAAVLITGHYGPNYHDLTTLLDLLQPHVAVRLRGLPDFAVNPGFAPSPAPGTGTGRDTNTVKDHAGRVETSQLWALEPDCVDVSRLPDAAPGSETVKGPLYAMGKDAHEADRRVGERMVRDQVNSLGKIAAELLAAYRDAPPPADRKPMSFAEVERFWAVEIEPILPNFACLQTGNRPPLPDGSRWRLNR